MAVSVAIDTEIFKLQPRGGISRLWRELRPVLSAAMPDAVIAETEPADVFISTYYKLPSNGARSIAFVYDMIAERHPLIGPHHPDAVAKRAAIAQSSAVVAISQQAADDVKRFTGREATVTYCGGGDRFKRVLPSEREVFQARIGKPYVMLVGRRGLYKNAQSLYQAWGLWPGAASTVVLAVGGEDNLPQDAAFARAYPDAWQRTILSDEDLSAAYSEALALVYPSVYEGFGLPALEAMACGCPVICGETMREVCGEAGIYCDVFRPASIAQALDVAANPAARIEYVLRGYGQAVRFTWANAAAALANAIRSIT